MASYEEDDTESLLEYQESTRSPFSQETKYVWYSVCLVMAYAAARSLTHRYLDLAIDLDLDLDISRQAVLAFAVFLCFLASSGYTITLPSMYLFLQEVREAAGSRSLVRLVHLWLRSMRGAARVPSCRWENVHTQPSYKVHTSAHHHHQPTSQHDHNNSVLNRSIELFNRRCDRFILPGPSAVVVPAGHRVAPRAHHAVYPRVARFRSRRQPPVWSLDQRLHASTGSIPRWHRCWQCRHLARLRVVHLPESRASDRHGLSRDRAGHRLHLRPRYARSCTILHFVIGSTINHLNPTILIASHMPDERLID